MSITFQCPNPECKRRMTVKDELAGKKGVCTGCKQRIVVPSANGVAAVAPTPVAQVAPPVSAPPPKPPQPAVPPAAKASPAGPKPVQPRTAPTAPKIDRPATAKAPPAPAVDKPTPLPSTNGQESPPAISETPPSADVDAEAAAYLADEPKKKEDAPTSIKFNCEFCDTPMEVGLDMANKRTQCPECRRLVKVPDLAKPVKKDWLKNAQPEAAPEGATGTGKGATMVSEEALEAAGAIPDEPRTRREKVFRGVGVACAVLLLGWGVWGVIFWWGARKETALYNAVVEYAKSPAAEKAVGEEGVAALHLAVGDYHRLMNREGSADKARNEFQQALAHLGAAKPTSPERDAVLADLALALVELGGNEQEVEKGLRLKWDKIHAQLRGTLAGINDEEARLVALRAVSRRLIERDQAQQALDLAAQAFATGKQIPNTEAIAAIGLELFSAGKKKLAESAADKALKAELPIAIPPPPPPDGEGPRVLPPPPVNRPEPAITPSVAALSMLLGRKTEGFPPPDPLIQSMGEAEAFARKGDMTSARQRLGILQDENMLRARIALAATNPESKDEAELALKFAETRYKEAPDPKVSWLLLRLIDLGARAGVAEDRLQAVAKVIAGDEGVNSLRGRGQLLAFRAKLSRSKDAGDESAIDAIEKQSLSKLLAKQVLARHNTRRDSGFAKTVQSWSDPDKAFGAAGALLGLRSGDDEKKK